MTNASGGLSSALLCLKQTAKHLESSRVRSPERGAIRGPKAISPRDFGFAGFPGVPAQKPGAGTIISMSSVECGTKKENKKTSTPLLCQQYVVRTSTAEYQIRQPKPSKQDILPANMPIQFTLDNDLMKFKLNGKKYEFRVVGSSALEPQ